MKRLTLLSCLILCAVSQAAFAESFPNDTHTRVISKGSDCGQVLGVRNAYITEFNDGGGAGAALVIQVAVENQAYVKNFFVRPTDQGTAAREELAQNQRPYYEATTTFFYDGQEGSVDHFTILDQRVAPSQTHAFNIAVEMNGNRYTCSNVVVGK